MSRAWAIDLRWKDRGPGPIWLGILAVLPGEPLPHLRGCRVALWRTRQEARRSLWLEKARYRNRPDVTYWTRATVRSVDVRIKPRD